MKSKLIRNIKCLAGIREAETRMVKGREMAVLPSIAGAFLLIDDGKIIAFGKDEEAPDMAEEVIDGTGRLVLPCWCDPHTHIVYPQSREKEFVDRIKGLSYEEIAKRGGGILNSARQLAATSEEELFESAWKRLEEIIATGTGAVEIKSGYGLSVEGELKMLRVIKKLKEKSPLQIKATFLGAHAYPQEYQNNHQGYLNLLIHVLLPQIKAEGLADFIDVFCEKNYFSRDETEKILEAGAKHGLRAKIHVNQFNIIGGVEAAVRNHALSVDHLELISAEDISVLKNTETMPTALPACSMFLNIPFTPARKLMDAGLPLALGTDYNPGSAPSGNMNMVISLACTQMKMTPEEAINAATLNAAYAMGVEESLGSITVGKKANVMLTKPISSLASLPYSFGSNQIERVILSK
ncbi:MAG: imidazolonepropionase [Bacteroidetes bacterium]|nr:imidazolonepropionase [Bacteroidota bacterium]